MEFLSWAQDNWFTLLQSAGIVGSLLFTAISLRIDSQVRRVANLFEATKQHREIWTTLYSRPDLKRVVDASADLKTYPISKEEELFVNLLILHIATNYRAAQAGMFMLPAEIKADIATFFALPIPRAVWETAKKFQERPFVVFVEHAAKIEPTELQR